MKRFNLIAFIICASSLFPVSLSASDTTPLIEGKDIKEAVFYGRKASGDPSFPCKGLTTRICGRIVYKLLDTSMDRYCTYYTCVREVYDENDVIYSVVNEVMQTKYNESFDDLATRKMKQLIVEKECEVDEGSLSW